MIQNFSFPLYQLLNLKLMSIVTLAYQVILPKKWIVIFVIHNRIFILYVPFVLNLH